MFDSRKSEFSDLDQPIFAPEWFIASLDGACLLDLVNS